MSYCSDDDARRARVEQLAREVAAGNRTVAAQAQRAAALEARIAARGDGRDGRVRRPVRGRALAVVAIAAIALLPLLAMAWIAGRAGGDAPPPARDATLASYRRVLAPLPAPLRLAALGVPRDA